MIIHGSSMTSKIIVGGGTIVLPLLMKFKPEKLSI